MAETVNREDLLRLSFYKKTHYSGSLKGMRYRIEKHEEQVEGSEDKTVCFRAWVYPEPYSFEATDEAKKSFKDFPFENGSLDDIKLWLDECYEKDREKWENSPAY